MQPGDALPLIANRYDITVDELADFNDWEDGAFHPIYPGRRGAHPRVRRGRPRTRRSRTSGPTTGWARCPALVAGRCARTARSATSTRSSAGDFISRVADKNDLSIEELEAANAENPAYQSFAPGQELWLPCEGEELGRASVSVRPRRPRMHRWLGARIDDGSSVV